MSERISIQAVTLRNRCVQDVCVCVCVCVCVPNYCVFAGCLVNSRDRPDITQVTLTFKQHVRNLSKNGRRQWIGRRGKKLCLKASYWTVYQSAEFNVAWDMWLSDLQNRRQQTERRPIGAEGTWSSAIEETRFHSWTAEGIRREGEKRTHLDRCERESFRCHKRQTLLWTRYIHFFFKTASFTCWQWYRQPKHKLCKHDFRLQSVLFTTVSY